MYFSKSGVVTNNSRYARRFSSVFSTFIDAKRFPIVFVDSSAANKPLPFLTI
jgi:hypothetical protein